MVHHEITSMDDDDGEDNDHEVSPSPVSASPSPVKVKKGRPAVKSEKAPSKAHAPTSKPSKKASSFDDVTPVKLHVPVELIPCMSMPLPLPYLYISSYVRVNSLRQEGQEGPSSE